MPTMSLNLNYRAYVELMDKVPKGRRSDFVSRAILETFLWDEDQARKKAEKRLKEMDSGSDEE